MPDNYITNYNGQLTGLSADLDVNGKKIQGAEVDIRTNASNGDVEIQANGTGRVIIDGLKYPKNDGNPNEVLITDGNGLLRFAPQAAGGGGGSGNYYWQIAADDSTAITVLSDNIIKFIGGDGLTSASDAQGNITFNQASQSFSITGEATANAVSYNGTGAVALNVTLDHNALDDQYVRLDGTSTLAGALNLNSNNITNVGTIGATTVTANLTGNVTGNVTGDVVGSVAADDSTIIVDAVAGGVPFARILGKPTTVAGYGITDALALSSLSVGADASASGSGGIAFNDGTGVFTYTPPDLSPYLTAESDTLALVTGRGATTTNSITVGSITTTNSTAITTSDLTIAGGRIATTNSNSNIELDPAGTGIVDIKSAVTLPDAVNLTLGTGNTIAGAGANILNVGSQSLTLKSNTFTVKNFADDATLLSATNGGNVHLYYNNASKLNTSSDGVAVTGELEVSTNLNVTGDIGSANLSSGRITFATTNGVLTDNSKLRWTGSSLDVDGILDATTVQTEGIKIVQNDIVGTRSNENITIAANGTGEVQIDDPRIIGATLETTIGSDGGASGLPATPAQYLKISVNGTDYKIPLYNIT